jgi:hypothetical protein
MKANNIQGQKERKTEQFNKYMVRRKKLNYWCNCEGNIEKSSSTTVYHVFVWFDQFLINQLISISNLKLLQ